MDSASDSLPAKASCQLTTLNWPYVPRTWTLLHFYKTHTTVPSNRQPTTITKPRNINTSNFTSLQQSSLSGFSLDTHQQTLRLHPPGSESELGHHPMVFAVEEQLLGRVVGRLRVRVIEVPVWSRWAGKKGPSCSSWSYEA
ncbi:hypothetical protein OIU77_001350 [Salix suchowensis]|uniref:Uncharacterized protein n=1 Tax=Salix suchowensis TaxID=1278906 RepID=A0ABQ9B330_9ROSI|nr:hypothetical protein OIU77_001350 [Salix suchowensis]